VPGFSRDLRVAGNLAYIAADEFGLQIIDVSDPSDPVLVGGYDTIGNALAIHVAGDLAYVADRRAGLQMLQVMAPLKLEPPKKQGSNLVLTWAGGTAPFSVELRQAIRGAPAVLGVTSGRTFTVPLAGEAGFLRIRSSDSRNSAPGE
jgi:hypothetical protein